MTAENLILCIIAGLPALAALGIYLFFRRFRWHTGRSYRWLRLLAGNLVVLVFLMSLVVLAGECYYRFWYDAPDSFGFLKTSSRWFERHYQFNSQGYRDNVDYSDPIPPGKRRVMFLGDSFTVGHGLCDVDSRFANIIRKAHPDWDLQCIARNGWDTSQQLSRLAQLLGLGNTRTAPRQLRTDPTGRIVLAQDVNAVEPAGFSNSPSSPVKVVTTNNRFPRIVPITIATTVVMPSLWARSIRGCGR